LEKFVHKWVWMGLVLHDFINRSRTNHELLLLLIERHSWLCIQIRTIKRVLIGTTKRYLMRKLIDSTPFLVFQLSVELCGENEIRPEFQGLGERVSELT